MKKLIVKPGLFLRQDEEKAKIEKIEKAWKEDNIIEIPPEFSYEVVDDNTSEDCMRVLNKVMEYTYGMLTTEKEGLQHFIKSMIDDLPSVTPTHKVGKLIAIDDTHSKCSECGVTFCITSNDEWEVSYCPNCGADMRGNGNERKKTNND